MITRLYGRVDGPNNIRQFKLIIEIKNRMKSIEYYQKIPV